MKGNYDKGDVLPSYCHVVRGKPEERKQRNESKLVNQRPVNIQGTM